MQLSTSSGLHLLASHTMAGRSSTDATRFTATEPHAYSQSNPIRSSTTSSTTSSSQPLPETASQAHGTTSLPPPNPAGSQPPPHTETPREKVARLRAIRLAQRNIQLTTWERTVIRGRVWADRLHKFTTLSLIGFSSKAPRDYLVFEAPFLLDDRSP